MRRGKGGDVSAEPAQGGSGGLRSRAWGRSLARTQRMKDMDVAGCQGGTKWGARTRGNEAIPQPYPASEGRSGTCGLFREEARGCVLPLKEAFCTPGSLLQLQEPSFCEACGAAFPAQLSLFMGTGPGRPGRNYLSLGHAWCLAERTASPLHERETLKAKETVSLQLASPSNHRPHPPGLAIMDSPPLHPGFKAF